MDGKKEVTQQNHNEVEFSYELADSEDVKAVERMKEANKRVEKKQKE